LPKFTAERYRAQAGEYAKLVGKANGPSALQELQRLERDRLSVSWAAAGGEVRSNQAV